MNEEYRDVFHSNGVRVAVIGVLAVLALFLLAQTFDAVKSLGRPGVPATDTITVTGVGEATVVPDVARVSFTVENSAATVSAAQSATTKQMNAALEFVKGKNIAEKDVRTLSYDISPQYSYPDICPVGSICPQRPPKITGYRVAQTVQVTIRNLESVGEVLEGLGKQGVQNVSGPAFSLDDSTAGYDEARADAIAKAKVRADLLAKQLGVSLGKIVSFNESSGGYPPYPMYEYAYGRGGADTKAASTPSIPMGENTFTANVTITYEIR